MQESVAKQLGKGWLAKGAGTCHHQGTPGLFAFQCSLDKIISEDYNQDDETNAMGRPCSVFCQNGN